APAAAAATTCAAGTPVAGDVNGDGAPDLGVKVKDNWVDDASFFVSPTRTTQGTWLDLTGRVTGANLDLNTCADAIVVDRNRTISLVLGTPTGLDPATARTVVLPQAAGLGPDEVLDVGVTDFVHDGIAQLVVAGHVWDDSQRVSETPFVDVITLAPDGSPGPAVVLDASGLVSGPTAISGWPSAIVADDRAVVVGDADDRDGGRSGAGRVQVFTPDAAHPSTLVHNASIGQASRGVPGSAEVGDGFGFALALRDGWLAVGVPYETTGRAVQTGRVQLLAWDPASGGFAARKSVDQNSRGVAGTNESKDRFGGVLAIARGLTATGSVDVVVGVPNEDVGRIKAAGSVTIVNTATTASRTYTQNSKGVPGSADRAPSEALADGDYFGWAIGVLPTATGVDTLAIGAPGETNGDCLTQGYVVLSDGKRLGSATTWTYLKPPTTGCSHYDEDVFDGWGSAFLTGSAQIFELP
ncbi:hypothetical protein, partial [Propionicimonas sp.]|uniref:hypothetical protein n=1 Tax=Propionicimonas sp. TaxID=1955623 RepID=UPI0039E248CB